jgi:hypothetical protein
MISINFYVAVMEIYKYRCTCLKMPAWYILFAIINVMFLLKTFMSNHFFF